MLSVTGTLKKERKVPTVSAATTAISLESVQSSNESAKRGSLAPLDDSVSSDPLLFRQNQMFPSFMLLDPREKYVQVTVVWKDTSARIPILLCWTIEKAINEIVMLVALKNSEASADFTGNKFMLGKIDRKCPGMQIWMESEQNMFTYDIKQGVYRSNERMNLY